MCHQASARGFYSVPSLCLEKPRLRVRRVILTGGLPGFACGPRTQRSVKVCGEGLSRITGLHRLSSWPQRQEPPPPGGTGGPLALLRAHMFPMFPFLSPRHSSQAIRDLQAEVSRLRLQLEDSLHRPHPGSPTPAAQLDHSTRTQDRPTDSSPSWASHYGR